MKKVKSFFLSLLVAIVVLAVVAPFLFLVGLSLLLYTPIDYLRFRRSVLRKDFPRRYFWLCGVHPDEELYAAVKKRGFPVRYLPNEQPELPGSFLLGETLLMANHPLFYHEKAEQWLLWLGRDDGSEETDDEPDDEGTDDCISVAEAREHCAELFREAHPDVPCREVIFLYNEKKVKANDGRKALELLREEEGVILYWKHPDEELEKLSQRLPY